MAEKVKLGDREFIVVAHGTVEWDLYVMARVHRAGLDSVAIRDGETVGEFARRILYELIDSHTAFELYGAFLLPVGTTMQEWSPELAARTGGYVKHLDGEHDKAVLRRLLLSLLAGFFENGLASLKGSPSSFAAGGRPAKRSSGRTRSVGSGSRS